MKVKLIGSSVGHGVAHQNAISYCINGSVAIDAGSIGLISPLEEQKRIRHVLLSHTHVDHIASLPLFLDNVYEPGPDCPTIYGSANVLETLRTDIFNDRLWPDVVRLASEESPFLNFETIENGCAVVIEGLRITPVDVDHVVPTFGFVVEEQDAAILFSSDTGPTQRLWQVANKLPNLQAVFLEASFPDSMTWLAEKSAHLTPALFAAELEKLDKRDVAVIVVHVKLAYREDVVRELQALNLPGLEFGIPDRQYVFEPAAQSSRDNSPSSDDVPGRIELSEHSPNELRSLPGQTRGLLSGFRRLLQNDGGSSIWYDYRGRKAPIHHLRQLTAGNTLEWETAAVPEDLQSGAVNFVFPGSFGSFDEPESDGFLLMVNGRQCVEFDLAREDMLWCSDDQNVCLLFCLRWSSDHEAAGFFYVAVSPDLLTPGEPCRLAVTNKGTDSERWFGINPLTNAVELQTMDSRAD